MKNTIRTFIAVDLPQAVKAYLDQLSAELRQQAPRGSVRWVQPDRMHLTLRFIGETEKNLVNKIGHALDETAAAHRPFNLHLQGFGCFPNCRRPRVLWAGMAGDLQAAAALKRDIDQALIPFGWSPEERPFQPHLTVGRVKDARQLSEQRWPDQIQPLAIPVTSIHFVESELTPQGPIYTIRHRSDLAAA